MAESDGESLAALAPSEEWAAAVRAAPRELFIPTQAWASPMDGGAETWIDRLAAPEAWRQAVYSDITITTQLDDGAVSLSPETAPETRPTSSSTAPSLVVEFLRLLDPYPGDRVLEIGTGTGWTAALLSARLGSDRVASVEVDEHIANLAEQNLHRAGFTPRLLVGDGAVGEPHGGLFDRVHVTAGVREIPYAWVTQTRPGGILAMPWAPNHVRGYALRLAVTGETAVGRIVGDAGFMMLRDQRFTYPRPEGTARKSVWRVDPRRMTCAGRGLELGAAALMPGVVFNSGGLDGSDSLGVCDPASASYAIANYDGAQVTQFGPRNLWDELEAAYLTWVSWGEPGVERYGVIVDADGQHLWLDSPETRVTAGGR